MGIIPSIQVQNSNPTGNILRFVFRPGETSPTGNVFASFSALDETIRRVISQGQIYIEIDDSHVSPVVIPPKDGGYDWSAASGVTISGLLCKNSTVTFLNFSEGVTFTPGSITCFENFVHAKNLSSDPVITVPNGTKMALYLKEGANLISENAPFIKINHVSTNDSDLIVFILDKSSFDNDGTPVISLAEGVALNMSIFNACSIGYDSVSSDGDTGGVEIAIYGSDVRVSEQPNLLSELSVSRQNRKGNTKHNFHYVSSIGDPGELGHSASIVSIDGANGDVSFELPDSRKMSGRELIIKRIDTIGGNSATITTISGNSIDSVTEKTLGVEEFIKIVSDYDVWRIIG